MDLEWNSDDRWQMMMAQDLDANTRRALNAQAATLVEQLLHDLSSLPVAPEVAAREIRERLLAEYPFEQPIAPGPLLEDVVALLKTGIVHTGHPRYFGLFNPAPNFMGVVGDYVTAALNPQLAVWSHAPAANEIERHVLDFIGTRVGFQEGTTSGSFTTGGAEANLTAVLVALTRTFPDVGEGGLRNLNGQPTFYVSQQSHLAWLKIAHACGLGRDAVRLVGTDQQLELSVSELRRLIEDDRAAGNIPFFVAATAGTTAAGALDPLPEIAEVCRDHDLFFHVDAAWGGAVVLSDRLRPLLEGIELADSVTIDAHKWLSVPMGAGMFLTTDRASLASAFHVATSYMPVGSADSQDPYTHSVQWSRRFIGLKLFLSLACMGRLGYAAQIERDCALGDQLRVLLRSSGWDVVNSTPLPVVCFVDELAGDLDVADDYHKDLAARAVARGHVWISSVNLSGKVALRACITSFRTGADDLVALVNELDDLRRSAFSSSDA